MSFGGGLYNVLVSVALTEYIEAAGEEFSTWDRYSIVAQQIVVHLGGCTVGCSVAQLYPILCDILDCSTPGSPVLHYLLEFVQICVH